MFFRYAFLFALLGTLTAPAQNPPVLTSRVYYSQETALVQREKVNSSLVRLVVDRLIMGVTGKSDVVSAWRSLVTPKDVVGIKVSAAGGSVSGTHPEIVAAITEGLIAAGIPSEHIIVWDRRKSELLAAGFSTKSDSYTLLWIEGDGDGYDKKAPIMAPVIGKLIYGDNDFKNRASMRFSDVIKQKDQLSDESYLSNVLSKRVTKVINIPTLCDSYFTGVGGAIPNMIIPNLDNWRRFIKPPHYGDPYLAEIYSDPKISGKVVMTFLDAIVVQYAGGPFPDPRFAASYLTIYASKDPVAIDATAMRIIDEYRVLNKLPKIEPISTYIQSASSLGLGNYDESHIQQIRVGVDTYR